MTSHYELNSNAGDMMVAVMQQASPGSVLIEQFPPLVVIRLLDRNSNWWLPNTFSCRQVGKHVLLKQMKMMKSMKMMKTMKMISTNI